MSNEQRVLPPVHLYAYIIKGVQSAASAGGDPGAA